MGGIFIPPLGSVIRLEKDWHFPLHFESRNEKLMELAKLTPLYKQEHWGRTWRDVDVVDRKRLIEMSNWTFENGYPEDGDHFDHYGYWSGDWSHPFMFSEDTELKIDRIYLRQGQKDFDSVSFRSNCWVSEISSPAARIPRKTKAIRFWAKLADVNRIEGRYLNDR